MTIELPSPQTNALLRFLVAPRSFQRAYVNREPAEFEYEGRESNCCVSGGLELVFLLGKEHLDWDLPAVVCCVVWPAKCLKNAGSRSRHPLSRTKQFSFPFVMPCRSRGARCKTLCARALAYTRLTIAGKGRHPVVLKVQCVVNRS